MTWRRTTIVDQDIDQLVENSELAADEDEWLQALEKALDNEGPNDPLDDPLDDLPDVPPVIPVALVPVESGVTELLEKLEANNGKLEGLSFGKGTGAWALERRLEPGQSASYSV